MTKRGRSVSRTGLLAALAASVVLSAGAVVAQEQPATPAPAVQAPVTQPQAAQAPSAPAANAPAAAAPAEPQPGVQPAPPAAGAEPSTAISLTLPHDLSPWGMFMAADIIVKAVMIGLAFASFVTWTIWLAKSLEIFGGKLRARRAANAIGNAATLMQAGRALGHNNGPGALLVRAAEEEAALSAGALNHVSGDGPEGARHVAPVAHRGGRGAAHVARHRPAGDDRLDRAFRRPVRHGLGHHERLHRHLAGADHQSRRRGAGHRRGAARHRHGPGRGHPGGGHLQRLCALHSRLPADPCRCLGRRRTAGQPRPRFPHRAAGTCAWRRSRAAMAARIRETATTISRKATRSTSRRSSTSSWCC